MSDDLSDLLSHISGQSVNKQVQELAMILTRTLEIVINAVDMLEQNLNNLSSSINQRLSMLEQRVNRIAGGGVTPQAVKPVVQSAPAPSRKPVIREEPVEEESLPPEEPVYTPPQVSQQARAAYPTQPAAYAAPAVAPQTQEPQPPRPINPINIRQALNTELKQLFTKMRSQTE
ncbi:MAG: hypothetical protein QW327_05520 [Candidatus Odinarchaeota archaeon]